MIAPALLAGYIHACAPRVDVATESAVVSVESGARPWVLADPDGGRSYDPRTEGEAASIAAGILARGHRVAVGLGQVLLPRAGYSVSEMLNPCQNLTASQRILSEFYSQQYRASAGRTEFEHQQVALDRAFSAYNSGSPTASPGYVRRVLAALSEPYVRSVVAAVSPRRSVPSSGPRPTHTPQSSVADTQFIEEDR